MLNNVQFLSKIIVDHNLNVYFYQIYLDEWWLALVLDNNQSK